MVRATLITFVLIAASSSLSAKSWQGIEPLRSTRSDVVRLIHECSDQKEACTFAYNNEDVYILFSNGLNERYSDCAKALPSETVIFIESRPRAALKPSEFQVRSRDFTNIKLSSSWDKSHYHYQAHVDKSNGLVFKTREGRVVQVIYLPSGSIPDACMSYYEEPESFAALYQGHVPIIIVECPKATPSQQQPFLVSATSDFATKRGFEWSVNAGKIIAGQNTSRVTIDATGLAGKLIKVAAVVQDYDLGFVAISTCDVPINK